MIKKFYESHLKDNADIILSIVIAAVFYISVFGLKTLNPANYKWLLMSGSDLTQNYLGGAVYRASPWSWPPFNYKSIGYPYGVSVLNTDSLPIMAILFKCLTTIFGLSPKYQFFGIWILVCLILQAFFAVKILRKIFSQKYQIVIASMFFIVSPMLIWRIFVHCSLCGHWLILASILLYLNDRLTKKEWFYFSLIEVLSLLIHPYFLPMTFPLLSALVYKKLFQDRETSFREVCLGYSAVAVAMLITMYLLGTFENVEAVDNYAWKLGSMNLNALINPMFSGSLFMKALARQRLQYEGYNYLGFGLIILLFLFAKDLFSMLNEKNLKNNAGILVVCLFMLIFSLSNDIYIGNSLIFSYKFVITDKLGSIFRYSGRIFWVLWYLLAYLLLRRLSEKEKLQYILPIICFIQLVDLAPLYIRRRDARVRELMRKQDLYRNPLSTDEWDKVFATYRHVFITKIGWSTLTFAKYFWEKIIDKGIVVNAGYLSRPSKKIVSDVEAVKDAMMSGYLPEYDTIYVIDEEFYGELSKNSSNRLLGHIKTLDDIMYILPSEELLNREGSINFNEKIYFSNSGKYINPNGFSSIDETEYWSLHQKASLNFRLNRLPHSGGGGDLLVKLEIVPFIKNKTIKVKVLVNGKKLAKWVFRKGKQQLETNLRIPRNLIGNSGVITIEFRPGGINSMKKLGLGTDDCEKGIGLVSMELEELNTDGQN